jgi:hypothetical protein
MRVKLTWINVLTFSVRQLDHAKPRTRRIRATLSAGGQGVWNARSKEESMLIGPSKLRFGDPPTSA